MEMTQDLIINSRTSADITHFLRHPAQFLILMGPEGSGKLSLAKYIGKELLGVADIDSHPQLISLTLPENKSEISIDQVREAIARLRLKTPGKSGIRRLLIIQDGQYLSGEAQNALLKILEEPPADTQIIMTLDAESSVLPTIISRARIHEVRPVDKATARQFDGTGRPAPAVDSAWLLAEGRAGLMHALLADSESHELKTAVSDAKRFLSGTKYERLIASNEFTKNRRQLELLIEGLQRVIKIAQTQSILNGKPANQAKLLAARRLLEEFQLALRANVSLRIIYLELCLNLGV